MRRERSGDVDFEIAFSALLATLATYISVESFAYEWAVESAAILLLVLTLIRRVGYMNGLKNTHPVFPITTHIMSGISYVVSVYLLFWLSGLVTIVAPQFDAITVFLIMTVPLVITVAIVQELAIGGFMEETESIFGTASRENQGTAGGAVWGKFEAVSRASRTEIETYQTTLSKYRDSKTLEEISPEKQRAALAHLFGSFVGLLLPFVVYGALGYILAEFLPVSLIVSLWAIMCFHMITSVIDVWLSGYGLIPINETGWVPKVFSTTVGIVFMMVALPISG